MMKFTRKEKLAVYVRLLAVLFVALIAVICILFRSGQFQKPATPTDTTKPGQEGTTPAASEPATEPVTEPATEEPTTEKPTSAAAIDDSFFKNTLFIGESRMEALYISDEFSSSDFLYNATGTIGGIEEDGFTLNGGDSYLIQDVLSENNYDKEFLMFGMNELGWSSDDYYLDQYEILVSMIKEHCPDAHIYIMSTVYVTEGYESEVEWIDNSKVDTFNSLVQTICDGETVTYLDVNTLLTTDGYLASDNSTNGFQFTGDFMAEWKKAIIEQLQS